MEARVTKLVKIRSLVCVLCVSDWGSSSLDGVADDDGDPRMPGASEGHYWKIRIDADSGRIEGWPEGHTARIRYRVCRGDLWILCSGAADCFEYEGPVPHFLDTTGDGGGDRVMFDVDERGHILNWRRSAIIDMTGN